MLQSIRDRAQSWVFSVIIVLIVIAFAFWGVDRFFSGGGASNTVATVDGYKITQNALDVSYQRLLRQLQLQMGDQFSMTPQIENNLKQQAIDQIIQSYVLTQAALKGGYVITPGQVDTVLASVPAFQENGQFSVQRFQAVLNNLFYTEAAFINQLRTDLLINQLQTGIVSSAFVLPADVDTAYQLIKQTRDIQYIIIPKSMFAKDSVVTEAAQKAYYKNHQNEFAVPERVSINYIKLSLEDIASKLKFTDAELKQYYEANQNNYTLPARYHVAQILVQIPSDADKDAAQKAENKINAAEKALQAGEAFSKVAEKYSEDIATRQQGGVMPWFSAGMVDPAFENAVMQLKVGETSKPVRSRFGLSLIKLLEVKPKQILPFEQVKKQVRAMLAQQQAQKIFAEESEQLSNLTFSDSGSLKTAADTLHLPIETTGLFSRAGAKSGIAANPKVVSAAFSDTVLIQKYNSDPITLDDGTVVVLRLKQHQAASIEAFAAVQAGIIKTLTTEANKAAAQQYGQKLLKQAQQGKSLQQLAVDNQLKLVSLTGSSRHNNKVDANILDTAFSLPSAPSATSPAVRGISLPSGDYALVEVTQIMNGNISKLNAEDRAAYTQQLAQASGQMDYSLFVQQQLKNARVKMLLKPGAAMQ